MKRSWLLCFFVWSSVATATAQQGPEEAARQEAGVHFRQGVELFREGAFRAALVELERAQEISPDYRTLFNIGQTQLQLGEYVEAIKAFESYLEQGGSEVEPARREDTEENLSQLRKRVATLAISVNLAGADVYVDSTMIGKAPLGATIPVSVGRHRVFAQGADGATASQVIDVAGGDLREIKLELAAPAPAPAIVTAPPPQPATERRGLSKRRRWAVGLLGSGVMLGVGAGVSAIFAKQAHDDYEDALGAVPGSKSKITSTRKDAKLRSYITDGLSGGAALLGVISIVVFASGNGDEEKPASAKVQVSVSPNGLQAQGVF